MNLFCRNQEIVDGLAAGNEVDVGVRAGLVEDLQRAVCLILGGVGAGIDGDKLAAVLAHFMGQLAEQHVKIRVGAEQAVVVQRQIIAGMDVAAVDVGIPGGISDLHGLHIAEGLGHGGRQLLFLGVGVEAG